MTRVAQRPLCLLGVAAVALLLGCSGAKGIHINTDHDPTASFVGMRTYAWIPDRNSQPALRGSNDPFLAARLEAIPRIIEQELVTKGFRKDPSGRPDFRIAYRVATRKGRIDSFQDYGWYKKSGGTKDLGTTYVTGYEEGSLTIDIVDVSGKRLLWRGTARAVVDDNIPSTQRQARLQRAVSLLLESFPPKR